MMAKLNKRDSDEMSPSSSLEPELKRHRKSLTSFSIESIMRSAAEECGQRASPAATAAASQPPAAQSATQISSQQPARARAHDKRDSGEKSGHTSPALSVGSARRNSESEPDEEEEEDDDDDDEEEEEEEDDYEGACRSPTSISGQSTEADESRASTPAKPSPAVGGQPTEPRAGERPAGGGGKAGGGPGKRGGSSSAASWSKERGATNHLLKQRACHDPRLAPFDCHLENLDLWHKFHPLDTEMIITKQGRRMFPAVRVTFSVGETQMVGGVAGAGQLNPREKYQVLMDILPYDHRRYRYAYHKSSWQQAGKADPPSPTKLFLHPDGPFTLDQLRRQVISFEKIKLTNNDANKHGMIVLNSMHKYQPRIHLVLWRGKESQNLANAPISLLEQEVHKTFIFNETIFTAVTAYQNHSITKLKIDSNPFAKGFRDSSRLTDLELESMQDLMGEGQCPFSPPRAPPHGFPHFLFAAAHQPPGQMEDPAAALLRERTIMALDSFLQQHSQSGLPPNSSAASPQTNPASRNPHQKPNQSLMPSGAYGPPPPYPGPPPTYPGCPPAGLVPQPVGGQPGPGLTSGQLEQLIMQQQQQFAAAMAAAAAAGHHAHQQGPAHPLFGSPHPPPSSSAGPPTPHQLQFQHHRSPGCGQLAAPMPKSLLDSPGRSCQLSPITASGAKQSPLSSNPGNSDTSLQMAPGAMSGQQQYNAAVAAAAAAAAFHPKHFEAMMAAHQQQQQHQHQMAALSMQLGAEHQQPVGGRGRAHGHQLSQELAPAKKS